MIRCILKGQINSLHSFKKKELLSQGKYFLINKYSTIVNEKKSKICIVGSGPAALYTAQYILKSLPEVKKSIDIFEKLPVPFGLVRYGVAPDHQDVKNVINSFTDTLKNENVNFFGNIGIGSELYIKELISNYNCVVLAYGSHSENYLNVPGEKNFLNFISAKDLVGWYNGLPGSENFNVDLTGKKAVIIGAGNVALDIARILLSPVENLATTDISAKALKLIREKNSINDVTIVARRGILNAAFTIKELRELTKIKSIKCEISVEENFKSLNTEQILTKLARPRKRLTEFMLKMTNQNNNSVSKTLKFAFLRSPVEILGDSDSKKVSGVKFRMNEYNLDFIKSLEKANTEDILNKIPCTQINNIDPEIIPADLVVRSIGFKNVSIDPDLPFDKKTGVILNDKGKVANKDGLYCTGWIKRGPRGVIVDTTTDANETAKKLCTDLKEATSDQLLNEKPGTEGVIELLKQRNIQYVDKYGWKKIDEEEIRRGKAIGKPRDKIQKIDEMLRISRE